MSPVVLKTHLMNKIRSSAENSSYGNVNKTPNKSENVGMFRGNRFEGKFFSKNVINLSRKNISSVEITFYPKELNLFLLQNKTIKES